MKGAISCMGALLKGNNKQEESAEVQPAEKVWMMNVGRVAESIDGKMVNPGGKIETSIAVGTMGYALMVQGKLAKFDGAVSEAEAAASVREPQISEVLNSPVNLNDNRPTSPGLSCPHCGHIVKVYLGK